MMRGTRVVLLLAAMLALSGCWSSIVLDYDADGTGRRVGLGDRIEVNLPGTAGTGYAWELAEESAPGVVELLGEPEFIPDDPDLCGSSGVYRFRFAARRTGNTRLGFVFKRPWEDPIEDRYEIVIAVR
jgi:predicted secreted protein